MMDVRKKMVSGGNSYTTGDESLRQFEVMNSLLQTWDKLHEHLVFKGGKCKEVIWTHGI